MRPRATHEGSKTLFSWSGGPRSSGVSFFCFHARGDTKQKKLTPLDRGPSLHVNRVLLPSCVARGRTHEGNKSHNHELKADKRLIFTLARIPQGMQKMPLFSLSIVHHSFVLLFFNTACWHWWHSQVPRLFNYVSFSKSHFKLVVCSEC